MSRIGTTTRDRARSGDSGGVPGGASAVTPLRPRRRRSRRRVDPRSRLAMVFAAALLVAGLVAWVVLGSPLRAVRTVQVAGAVALPDAQVAGVAGVAEGTPLMRVDTEAAAARVARLPQVRSVEVTRGWPGTVVVTLVERVPVAVVETPGSRQLIDAEGVLFDTITGPVPDGVVSLTVPEPGPEDAATRAALGAVVALPAEVRDALTGVTATTGDDVTLALSGGRTVRWGSAAETDRKAEVLGALLTQIDSGALEPAEVLDVSTPDAVVLR